MSPTDIGGVTWRPGYTGDPHPFFAEPQILTPVSRGVLDGVPVWLVTRYEDVRRLLADPAVSSDPQHAGPAAAAIPWVGASQPNAMIRHIVRLDPPAHTRLRRLVVSAFTARRVAALRPRVQQITDDLVGTLLPRGRADLVSDFALPLPVTVISELLGVPADGRRQFLRWSNVYLGVEEGDVGRRPEALGHITEYLGYLIDQKSRHPVGGTKDASLLDALIAVRDEGDRLSHDELLGMAFLLLIAGHVGFGHGVHFCLGAPLARLEAEIAFTALLTRFPALALGPGTPAWRHSFQLHSLKTLAVSFTRVPMSRPPTAAQLAIYSRKYLLPKSAVGYRRIDGLGPETACICYVTLKRRGLRTGAMGLVSPRFTSGKRPVRRGGDRWQRSPSPSTA